MPVAGHVQAQPGGATGAVCATCGAVPDLHGPTPECRDESGCGRVLRTRGALPVGRAVEPGGVNAPGMGGSSLPGTSMLVNRETGEQIFAGGDGTPYGRHDDYNR